MKRIPATDTQRSHRAENGNERDRNYRRREHRKRFGEGERVKELAFLTGQREDRNEGQHDNRH